MRDSFIFYDSFYKGIRELNPEEQLEIYNAIFEYEFEKKEPQLDGVKKAIWSLIKPQLDANNERYENGCKGGRPKKDTEKEETKKTNGYKNKKPVVFEKSKNKKTSGYENKKPNDNDNDNENDNENDNDNDAENENDSNSNSKKNVLNFYMNNINQMPTPREVELLESYEEDTPHELIIYAMEKAVENKARSMRIY